MGPRPFVLSGMSWLPLDLTYGFVYTTPDLGEVVTQAAVVEALALREAVTPVALTGVVYCGLPFNDPACAEPDIRILFGGKDHGDPFPFNAAHGVLANAFLLSPAGDVHFDRDEQRSDSLPSSGIDLVTVAAHEIGHALGLDHAESEECPDPRTGVSALMCACYTGPYRFLIADDIAGIRALYGSSLSACPLQPHADCQTLSKKCVNILHMPSGRVSQ